MSASSKSPEFFTFVKIDSAKSSSLATAVLLKYRSGFSDLGIPLPE